MADIPKAIRTVIVASEKKLKSLKDAVVSFAHRDEKPAATKRARSSKSTKPMAKRSSAKKAASKKPTAKKRAKTAASVR